jgi:trans-aconitate methyltransferase
MPELKWNTDLYNIQHNFVYKYGENVLEWLVPQRGERILDVGCGTGQLTDIIHISGAVVTGIDASPEMIKKARENYPDIKFMVKDATHLSFDSNFDAVFSNAALHWISNQEEAIRCIFNALRPAGRFVFEMGGKHNIESIHNALKKAIADEHLEDKIPGESNYFPSVAEQCLLLEKIGFTVSDVMYFKRPTKLEGEEGMTLWIHQSCDFFFRNIGDDLKEKIIAKVVESLRATNYRDGDWNADYVRLRIKAVKE